MIVSLTMLFAMLLLTTQLFGITSIKPVSDLILNILWIPLTAIVKIIGFTVTIIIVLYVLIFTKEEKKKV
jgi:hypothetical protein